MVTGYVTLVNVASDTMSKKRINNDKFHNRYFNTEK